MSYVDSGVNNEIIESLEIVNESANKANVTIEKLINDVEELNEIKEPPQGDIYKIKLKIKTAQKLLKTANKTYNKYKNILEKSNIPPEDIIVTKPNDEIVYVEDLLEHIIERKNSKLYVITNKELIFITAVFIALLIVMYPKDLLKEKIAAETSSYDLSMLYLKNLLKHSPNDESLMLLLAEQSLRSGNKELSIKLLDKLAYSKEKKIQDKSLVLAYELKKDQYFYIKDETKKPLLKIELDNLFYTIFDKKLYDDRLDYWYSSAIFSGQTKPIYHFLKQKIDNNSTDTKLLESGFYISSQLGHTKDSIKYINLLINYDKTNHDKWLDAYYYMLADAKEYKKAEQLLQKEAIKSIKWRIRLAEFYLMRKQFLKSAGLYKNIFKSTTDYKEKKKYFYKSIRAMQAGNFTKESVKLGRSYENYYIKDREVRKFLLDLYIATNHLDYASALADKIIKSRIWR